jgi:peptidylprolyl isomerase
MSNTVDNKSIVTVHYVGTLSDGSVFDSSRARNTPFAFTTGTGQVVPGFNDAVIGMTVGETKTSTLTADTAYGQINDNAFQVVAKSAFEEGFEFHQGKPVSGAQNGQQFQATIEGTTDNHVVLNFNHPLAGKDLTFEIEVLSIAPATETTTENTGE